VYFLIVSYRGVVLKPGMVLYESGLKEMGMNHDIKPFLLLLHPLKTEFLINNIYKFSSYLTGKTLRLRYKAQAVNAV
jgi:hypothetical protein